MKIAASVHSLKQVAVGAIRHRNAARWQGKRVGLLGGSFNPAHAGHRHISLEALKRLRLDAVWWLVSPQNPLKSQADMASHKARLELAERVANHPHIYPTDIECLLRTRFTIDTIRSLQKLHPTTHFIWLMGDDNLAQFHYWKQWPALAQEVPIAVMQRPGYSKARWASPARARLDRFVHSEQQARLWPKWRLPALVCLVQPGRSISSTALRGQNPFWAQHMTFDGKETRLPSVSAAPGGAGQTATSTDLHALVLQSLEDDKAIDVISIPLVGKSPIADVMILASGRSSRQVASMAEHLMDRLKTERGIIARAEGLSQGDWVLVDAGDVVVHLFRPEVRSFYNLEKMWSVEVPAGPSSA